MEGEFSKVSFLEQVGTWEPFAVESGLEVTCKLSLLKVIVLHSILPKFQMLITTLKTLWPFFMDGVQLPQG